MFSLPGFFQNIFYKRMQKHCLTSDKYASSFIYISNAPVVLEIFCYFTGNVNFKCLTLKKKSLKNMSVYRVLKLCLRELIPYLISTLLKIFLKINIILAFVKLYHVRKSYKIIVSVEIIELFF